MGIVSEGSLDVFPVGYPATYSTGHLLHEGTARVHRRSNARLSRDISPAVITFCNMFGGARGSHGHAAIDVLAARGLPVFSTCAGEVVDRWRAGGQRRPGVGSTEHAGNFVMIKDRLDQYHYYTHMIDLPPVEVGDQIRAGQPLGRVGQTGQGGLFKHPHLHYQVSLRNAAGARQEALNPYAELVRLATACGGAFEEPIEIQGYQTRRWMIVRHANFPPWWRRPPTVNFVRSLGFRR